MFTFCLMVRDHNSSPIQWKINLPKTNWEKEFKHLEILDEEKHFKIRKREPEKPWVNKKTRKEEETTAERPPKTLLKFYSIVKKSCASSKRGLEKEEIIIFNCFCCCWLAAYIFLDDRNGKWFSMSELVTTLPESKPEEQSVSKAETILTATFWVYEIL